MQAILFQFAASFPSGIPATGTFTSSIFEPRGTANNETVKQDCFSSPSEQHSIARPAMLPRRNAVSVPGLLSSPFLEFHASNQFSAFTDFVAKGAQEAETSYAKSSVSPQLSKKKVSSSKRPTSEPTASKRKRVPSPAETVPSKELLRLSKSKIAHHRRQGQRGAIEELVSELRESLERSSTARKLADDPALGSLLQALQLSRLPDASATPGDRAEQKRAYKRRQREQELQYTAQLDSVCALVLERAHKCAPSGPLDQCEDALVRTMTQGFRAHGTSARQGLDLIVRLRRGQTCTAAFPSAEELLSELCSGPQVNHAVLWHLHALQR